MRTIASMILLGLLSACTSLPATNCKAHEQPEVQDTLYFGTGTSTGLVTSEAWTGFLAGTITPRFPQGLTVLDASGQWLSANGKLVVAGGQDSVFRIWNTDDGNKLATFAPAKK